MCRVEQNRGEPRGARSIFLPPTGKISRIFGFPSFLLTISLSLLLPPGLFMHPNFSHDSRPHDRRTRSAYKDTCCIVQIAQSERDSYTRRRRNIGWRQIYFWLAHCEVSFCFAANAGVVRATIWSELATTHLPRREKYIILGAKCRLNKKKPPFPVADGFPEFARETDFSTTRGNALAGKPIRTTVPHKFSRIFYNIHHMYLRYRPGSIILQCLYPTVHDDSVDIESTVNRKLSITKKDSYFEFPWNLQTLDDNSNRKHTMRIPCNSRVLRTVRAYELHLREERERKRTWSRIHDNAKDKKFDFSISTEKHLIFVSIRLPVSFSSFCETHVTAWGQRNQRVSPSSYQFLRRILPENLLLTSDS